MLELNDEQYAKYHRVLTFTIAHEGGYVNHPNDPGGETKWGISKRAYPNEDIKNLTPERAAEIYYEDYFLPSGCNEVDEPFTTCLFDAAVHHGTGRARNWARQVNGNVDDFLQLRKNFLILLAKQRPSSQVFLKGWLRRIADLEKYVANFRAGEQTTSNQKLFEE